MFHQAHILFMFHQAATRFTRIRRISLEPVAGKRRHGSEAGTGASGEDTVERRGKLRDASPTTLSERRLIETFQMLKGYS